MNKKQITFHIFKQKKKTEIVIYDTIVLINKIKAKFEVTLLNGEYYGHKEIGSHIIENLNEEDQERFIEYLRNY